MCLSCDCHVSRPPAPIGSVEVSLTCSSSGGKSVSCSSDGDLLIYSWTLNGDPLTDANTNIHLNETTEGVVICSVKNHVSQQQKNISIDCPGELFIHKLLNYSNKSDEQET